MTVVYIDQLFLLNFIANYLLLLGTGRVTGAVLHRVRIALGAVAGAVYSVLVFMPNAIWLNHWLFKVITGVTITLIAYAGEIHLLKTVLTFFAASAGLAGVVIGVGLLGKTSLITSNGVLYSEVHLRLLVLLFVICYFLMSLFFRRSGRHIGRDTIKLKIWIAGEMIALTALIDSGHTLTDPMTNRPVIVANAAYFRRYIPQEINLFDPIEGIKECQKNGLRNVRLVPYRAIGVECGMLLALKSDRVLAGERDMGKLLIALSPTPIHDGGSHQALIGGI